jgi:hypothetical protein
MRNVSRSLGLVNAHAGAKAAKRHVALVAREGQHTHLIPRLEVGGSGAEAFDVKRQGFV